MKMGAENLLVQRKPLHVTGAASCHTSQDPLYPWILKLICSMGSLGCCWVAVVGGYLKLPGKHWGAGIQIHFPREKLELITDFSL